MANMVGLFPDRGSAENAMRALQGAGFDPGRMSIATHDRREAYETDDQVGGIQSEQGRVRVTVDAMGREEEVRMIMRANNAEDLRGPSTNTTGTTSDLYRDATSVNRPANAGPAPMPGQAINTRSSVAPESLPPDTHYETSATNPRGYATQPVSNKPDDYAGQTPGALSESNAPGDAVVLPPEMRANPTDDEYYDERDKDGAAARPEVHAGPGVPSADDTAPMGKRPLPQGDERIVNPEGTQDASGGESEPMRDEDIIRQEQQRME
jgi:hypothetical protein